MFNHILWTLDNEMDGTRFERLCTDLLAREGYKDIVPIGGTHDRGRDAELRRWKGIKTTGGVTFFQYSLEGTWEKKLKRELEKVYQNGHQIDFYVFVTSRSVTGEKRDKLGSMVATKYQWQLIIYDREWLRHRLEEAHPELTAKYLAIPESIAAGRHLASELKPSAPQTIAKKAWQLYSQGEYEAAAVEFKGLLKENGQDVKVWQAMAWCQYSLFRYSEALTSINHAISLDKNNGVSWTVKASILTEDGIQKGLKTNLLLARDIFKRIAENSNRWVDHYNYGNTLQALGNYDEAKCEFLLALSYDSQQAEIWTNLGSVYFHLNDHKAEIDCYDKALAINSRLPEALASKGVTLLRVFGKAQDTVELILQAEELDHSIGTRWPHMWYWIGQAYFQLGNLAEALKQVNAGLGIIPYHSGLLDLKALILSKIWPEDSEFIDEALSFFKFRVELSSDDYDSFAELVRLYIAASQRHLAFDLLRDYADLGELEFQFLLEIMEDDRIEEYLVSLKYISAYRKFRTLCPISDYMSILADQEMQPDDDFENTLLTTCGISFGLACDVLNVSQSKKEETIKTMYSVIQKSLRSLIPHLGTKSLKAINIEATERISSKLAGIITVLSMIALLELSRQVGFVGGFFGLLAEDLDKTTVGQGGNLVNWQSEIAGDTLLEINKQLKIFKE